MNTKPERDMLSGILPVNDESVCVRENAFVTITGQIPHDDLVAFLNVLAIKIKIF